MVKQYAKKTLFDRTSNSLYIYIGSAACGSAEDDAVWVNKRVQLDTNGNFVNIKYANGDALINAKWSERTTLEYI